MMTQSVMTQAMNLLGNVGASVNTRSSKSGVGFEQLMDHNLSSGQNPVESSKQRSTINQNNRAGTKTDASKQKVNKEATVKDKPEQKAKTESNRTERTGAGAEETKKVAVTDASEDLSTEDAHKTSLTEDENLSAMEELLAQMNGMLQRLQEAVMQALGLNQEEFDQLIEQYQDAFGDISPSDLLKTDVLKQLVLFNQGSTDPCAFLTDEKLEQTMKQLLQTVEQIKAEAGIELTPEEINALLQQATGSDKEMTENSMIGSSKELLPSSEKSLDDKRNVNSSDMAETTSGSLLEEGTIRISVSKDTTGSQAKAREEDSHNQDYQGQFQSFVDKLVETNQTRVDMTGSLEHANNLRDIANQIIEKIRVAVKPDQTSMELTLTPEHLGKVNLSIQSKDGAMTAHFVVQNEISKEAIESQLQILKDTLDQQGIKVEAVEVTVAAYAFDQNNRQDQEGHSEERKSQRGRRITLEEAFTMSEVVVDEGGNDSDGLRGNQIDYTA